MVNKKFGPAVAKSFKPKVRARARGRGRVRVR
jgi:hypothetical protein